MIVKHAPSNEELQERMRKREQRSAALEEYLADLDKRLGPAPAQTGLSPLARTASGNELRPGTLDEVVGQARLKPLLARLIASAKESGRPLSHMLFVGASGTGKTTLATVVANEVGTRIFALKAPLDMGVLRDLQSTARDRDVIFVDEIHLQTSGDRRGITEACDPESFYLLLEDGLLSTATGPVGFPKVTWIGATTDVGLLPEPLSNRFPIQPRLSPYTVDDMTTIGTRNAEALDLNCQSGAVTLFAGAARGIPRQLNSYMRAARDLAPLDRSVSYELAREVVEDLNSTTLDGLTYSMQTVLRYLRRHCGRETRDGRVYRASVNALATAAGHGRDTKAISLLVEPALIEMGFLSITPGGRQLTDAGVQRAEALLAQRA